MYIRDVTINTFHLTCLLSVQWSAVSLCVVQLCPSRVQSNTDPQLPVTEGMNMGRKGIYLHHCHHAETSVTSHGETCLQGIGKMDLNI